MSPNAKIMLLASPNSRLPHGSVTAHKCNGPTSPWSTRLLDRESPPSQKRCDNDDKHDLRAFGSVCQANFPQFCDCQLIRLVHIS
ncbi:unnamed protein product [Wuchereria bancrofti]|uniref:Uncharacterized protein n=1 Tax=Wuchereria bancrofti TaxID=6293 RepID=A0A3P7FTH7_WUCBA|nr:unnamed protein product [Wuchereria bancrofti]